MNRPHRKEYVTLYLTAERTMQKARTKPSRIILSRPIEKSYMKRLHQKTVGTGESGLRVWCRHFVTTMLPEGGWELITFSHVKPKRPGHSVTEYSGTYHCSPLYGTEGEDPETTST